MTIFFETVAGRLSTAGTVTWATMIAGMSASTASWNGGRSIAAICAREWVTFASPR